MSAASNLPTKSVFMSKTFWAQLLALATMLSPQVRLWVADNPVEFAAAWAALNILVRFATSGKVSLAGDQDGSNGGGSVLPLIALMGLASGLGGALTSCAEYPLTGSLMLRDPKSGAKGGLVFTPGQRPSASIKYPVYDPKTGELLGMADLSAAPRVDRASGK